MQFQKLLFALILLTGASVASITYANFFNQTFNGDIIQGTDAIDLYFRGTDEIQRLFFNTVAGDGGIRFHLVGDNLNFYSDCTRIDGGFTFATSSLPLGVYTVAEFELWDTQSCDNTLIETTTFLQNVGDNLFNIVAPSSTITTSTIFVASTTIFYSFGQTLFYGIILFIIGVFLFGFYFWKK